MAFGPIISWQIEGEKVEKLADFIFRGSKITGGASLIAQLVKNPPAMWETWVHSLGWEDPLEEGIATHSIILAWRIPMDSGAWRLSPVGHKGSDQLSD